MTESKKDGGIAFDAVFDKEIEEIAGSEVRAMVDVMQNFIIHISPTFDSGNSASSLLTSDCAQSSALDGWDGETGRTLVEP